MHTSKVLRKQVFSVEIVIIGVLWISDWAHVTAPEAYFDVLRADVALPFVL